MLSNYKNELSVHGHDPVFMAVYGSQNYGLSIFNNEYQSDLDFKAVVVPTLDDLVNNSKGVSTVIETSDGQADVKDIRNFINTLLKGNPAYLETLFACETYIDENFRSEFREIFNLKEELVKTLRFQMLRALYGMMKEKEKALKHPYPSIKEEIEEFGYSGKQAHHVLRLKILMDNYFKKGMSFGDSLKTFSISQRQILEELKLNIRDLESAEKLVQSQIYSAQEFKNKYLEQNKDVERTMNYEIKHYYENISKQIIKNKIIEGVKNG